MMLNGVAATIPNPDFCGRGILYGILLHTYTAKGKQADFGCGIATRMPHREGRQPSLCAVAWPPFLCSRTGHT